jgi:hypothetical protein
MAGMQSLQWSTCLLLVLWEQRKHKPKGNKDMDTVTVYNGINKSKTYQATVLAFRDGLTFVEHPIYGDEAPIQIVQKDGTLKPSHAWDVDAVYDGDY